jgi:Family of unknown function (DUF6144)
MAVDHKARKLVESIEAVAGQGMAEQITRGLKEPTAGIAPRKKAEWAREVIARMDALLPQEQRRGIMERRRCHASQAGIRRDKALWDQCASLEEYAQARREQGWTEFYCEGDTLRFQISSGWCHCGLVRAREAPISKTYCLCCAGHMRYGLEPVFGSPVHVEPLSTVISGDDECWFVAHIPNVGQRPAADG